MDKIVISGWFGFWLFMAVLLVCDCWVFMSGRDSYLQYHKTDAEKALQRAAIEATRQRAGLNGDRP